MIIRFFKKIKYYENYMVVVFFVEYGKKSYIDYV